MPASALQSNISLESTLCCLEDADRQESKHLVVIVVLPCNNAARRHDVDADDMW